MQFLQPDSPLMQFISRVADIMILNFLFLLACIPVVTAGAAMTAAHKVTQNMAMQKDSSIAGAFWKSFRSEFGKSTAAWILTVAAAGVLFYDGFLVFWYLEGGMAVTCYLFLAVFFFLILGTSVFTFALLARYQNRLGEHIRNAFFLVLGHLPRAAASVVLSVLPLAVPFFFPQIFIRFIWLWFFFFFGLSFLGLSLLMKPVFFMAEENRRE